MSRENESQGPDLVAYGANIVRVADGDTARVAEAWHAAGLDIDWQQKLHILYEFTLYYLHITDRFVAGQVPAKREEIMQAVTSAAWYAHLVRTVKQIPDDLAGDPAVAENWRGFCEDLQLRHQLLGQWVWERADDPQNQEGTLGWEFAKFLGRTFDRPEDIVIIMGVQLSMMGSLAELNSKQLIVP